MIAAPNKTRQHTVYKLASGTRVPGVTTILGVLNKPALIPWANRLGLQGIDSTKYVDEKADIGTCCHYMIQCDVAGEEPDLDAFSPATVRAAENGYIKWLDWRKGKAFRLILSEEPLVSEAHRFGGTIDIYAEVDNTLTLLDLKTSGSGIWPEMKHQVSAYKMLLEEHGHKVDECRILRVGRDESEGFEEAVIGNVAEHQRVFLLCRELYDAQKLAK